MVSGEWWQTKFSVSPGPGLWSLVLGPFGPDLGPDLDLNLTIFYFKALKNKKKSQKLNTDYFYTLLFTRENLKLVHIVCHDKQEHSSKKCIKNKFYL